MPCSRVRIGMQIPTALALPIVVASLVQAKEHWASHRRFIMAPKPKQRRKRDFAKVQQDRTKRTRKPKKPAARRKLPPYTPPEQRRPYGDAVGNDHVRKIRSASTTSSKTALSLRELLTKPEGDLACRYVSAGVFKDREGELCSGCGEGYLTCGPSSDMLFKPQNDGGHPAWRCNNEACRKGYPVTQGSFLEDFQRVPFGVLMGSSFLTVNRFAGGSLTPRDGEKLIGLSRKALSRVQDRVLELVEKHVVRRQASIKMHGQCEFDEAYPVSFRKKAAKKKVYQMRIFAARVRGDNQSLVVDRMSDIQMKTREGSHGASPSPTTIQDVDKHLWPYININVYTIAHADGAGAYRNVDAEQRLSPKGNLHLTQVSHTPVLNAKTGKKEIMFTKLVDVPLESRVNKKSAPRNKREVFKKPAASVMKVMKKPAAKKDVLVTWAGTQYMDGGFKHMRATWPQSMNYGTPQKRELLMRWIRMWQFRTWYSGEDLFDTFLKKCVTLE